MIEKLASFKNQKFIMIAIFLSSFLTAFSTYTTVISAKVIGLDLGMEIVTIGWVSTIFILAAAMFQIPFGKLGDLIGRKRIFLSGVVLFTICSIFLPIANSSSIFITFRFIQGIGAAFIFAAGNAILTASYPPYQRGKAIGINVTGVYIGLTLSPLFGGILIQNLGWRSQFWINVPFGILILLLVLFKVKGEWKSEKREKIDYIGSIIYALFLFSLIYAFSLLPTIQGYTFLLISVIGAVIFILWEKKITYPMLDLNLFKNNRYFSYSCLVSILFYISTIALALLLSLYMQYLRGMSPQEAGYILLIQPLMQTIFSPIVGKLSDTVDSRKLVSGGVITALLGIILLVFLNSNYPIYIIAIAFGIIGLGTAFFSSPNIRAIMSSVPKNYLGVASGLEGTMRSIGQTLSFGILTITFAVIIGNVEITLLHYSQYITSARIICIIFAILALVSLVFSILRGKKMNVHIVNHFPEKISK